MTVAFHENVKISFLTFTCSFRKIPEQKDPDGIEITIYYVTAQYRFLFPNLVQAFCSAYRCSCVGCFLGISFTAGPRASLRPGVTWSRGKGPGDRKLVLFLLPRILGHCN